MPISRALNGAAAPTEQVSYAPRYNIDQGYPHMIQEWINTSVDPGAAKATIKFSSDESEKYDWKSVGFKEVKVDGTVGFAPFFTARYSYNKVEKHEDVKATDSSTSIGFELSAGGIRSFSISPDMSW